MSFKKSYLRKLRSKKACEIRFERARVAAAAASENNKSEANTNEVINEGGDISSAPPLDSSNGTDQATAEHKLQNRPTEGQKMETRRYQKINSTKDKPRDGELLRRFDTRNFVKIKQSVLDFINGKTETIISEPIDLPKAVDEAQPGASVERSGDEEDVQITHSNLQKSTRKRRRDDDDDLDEDPDDDVDEVSDEDYEEEPDPEWNASNARPRRMARRQKFSAEKSGTPQQLNVQKCQLTLTNNSFPKMADIDMRCARYGWITQDLSNMSIVHKGDAMFPIAPPEDYLLYNDKKVWAGEYTMCIGQKNLCKWM